MDSAPASEDANPEESRIAEAPSPPLPLFNRIFNRHWMSVSVLMVLLMLFTESFGTRHEVVLDPDIWWHLADAREVCSTHQFLHTAPYAFTVAGERWADPEWLGELSYWFSYKTLELRGLYLFTFLVLSANLVFFYARGCWRAGHAGAAFWASIFGFVLISVNAGPRVIALAYLAMGTEMAILEAAERGNKRLLWLLPLLFAIWVNLHGSWLIGIGLLVLYILCGWFSLSKGAFEQTGFSVKDRNRLLLVLAACLVALMANPYGWRLVWNPIDMMLYQKLNIANVAEWKPLNLSTIAGAVAAITIATMVVANLIQGHKWKIYDLAILLFAWYAAVDHRRFAFMAAVLTIPILAEDLKRTIFTESDAKTIPAMNALFAAAAACTIWLLFPTEPALQQKVAEIFPMKTIDAIQPSWRTFNEDNLGGMMAFEFRPSFIDSRFDIFEHRGVMRDYLKVMYTVEPLKVLDQYRIDHVLVEDNIALAYLLHRNPGWNVEDMEKAGDKSYVLFVRTPDTAIGTSPILGGADSKVH
jgi:hypothetical protein